MAAPEEASGPKPPIYKTPASNRPLPSPVGLTRAFANGVAGFAHALTSGVQAFNQSLTTENITALSLDNGLIVGSVAANARFLEELAKLPQRLYEDLRRSVAEQRGGPGKDLDYDSIATLVAAKLSQKGPADTGAPGRSSPSGRSP
ncbi:MAG TPA: hypothetical protein VEJ89_08990 [Myxococcaceae bacterium]|jgi:hypothetical protein|nr:hypothetical protein [Myxococcaceae bacterium]